MTATRMVCITVFGCLRKPLCNQTLPPGVSHAYYYSAIIDNMVCIIYSAIFWQRPLDISPQFYFFLRLRDKKIQMETSLFKFTTKHILPISARPTHFCTGCCRREKFQSWSAPPPAPTSRNEQRSRDLWLSWQPDTYKIWINDGAG